jgi:hypothetical protein
LNGVENVLPDVLGGVGVSEGQHNELRVHADDTLDVFGVFLDWMGVDWFVCGIAYFAFPVEKVGVVVSADNERVGESNLILVRN